MEVEIKNSRGVSIVKVNCDSVLYLDLEPGEYELTFIHSVIDLSSKSGAARNTDFLREKIKIPSSGQIEKSYFPPKPHH